MTTITTRSLEDSKTIWDSVASTLNWEFRGLEDCWRPGKPIAATYRSPEGLKYCLREVVWELKPLTLVLSVASEQAVRAAYLSISRAGAEPAFPPQTLARGEGEAKIVTVEAAAKDLDGNTIIFRCRIDED